MWGELERDCLCPGNPLSLHLKLILAQRPPTIIKTKQNHKAGGRKESDFWSYQTVKIKISSEQQKTITGHTKKYGSLKRKK